MSSNFLHAVSVWHLQGPRQTMKSAEDVEGVYWVMGGASIGLRIFIQKRRASLCIPQEFLGKVRSVLVECRGDILSGSRSHSRLSCAASNPSPSVVEIRIPYATYKLSGIIISRSQCPDGPVRHRTSYSVGPGRRQFCLLDLFQCPFSSLQPTWFRRQCNLEFDTVDCFLKTSLTQMF